MLIWRVINMEKKAVFAVTVKTEYEREKRETELMAMTNSMLEKNFIDIENSHNTIRQQVHDFKNHLFLVSPA